VHPDVIYQNSFFSYDDLYPVLKYKKRHSGVKVIVAPRGEFYPERIHCGRLKKHIYVNLLRISGLLKDVYFQGTGIDECNQCRNLLGIPESFLLDIQNLAVAGNTAHSKINKQPGYLRLVYIARVHPTKNILNAICWLGNVTGQVMFDIYGPIEGEAYWQQCLGAISALPDNIRVSYNGIVEHDRVADVITEYHGYYMPTTGENFGHSIVESMLVGRPVVISDQTPWSDVHEFGGYAYSLNRAKDFSEAIQRLCDMEQNEYDILC
jgi:glycosyltransferase involved in cell wall biosynthesis